MVAVIAYEYSDDLMISIEHLLSYLSPTFTLLSNATSPCALHLLETLLLLTIYPFNFKYFFVKINQSVFSSLFLIGHSKGFGGLLLCDDYY